MLARVCSGALFGVDAVRVEVEVDMALGLPFFNVYGTKDHVTLRNQAVTWENEG